MDMTQKEYREYERELTNQMLVDSGFTVPTYRIGDEEIILSFPPLVPSTVDALTVIGEDQ